MYVMTNRVKFIFFNCGRHKINGFLRTVLIFWSSNLFVPENKNVFRIRSLHVPTYLHTYLHTYIPRYLILETSFSVSKPLCLQQRWILFVEVGRAWARARRSGSGLGFLLHKTQSPSLRVGLGPKPNFFTYVVKSKPDKKLNLLSKFFKPEKTQAQSMKPKPDKIRPDPPLIIYLKLTNQPNTNLHIFSYSELIEVSTALLIFIENGDCL
jgi:hypothetical protein